MRRVRHLLAAALLGAAAGGVAVSAPAQAAGCAKGSGVTVVVNSSVGCDPNGGGKAAGNFADAGVKLTYAARSPGFVCRVNGAPASDPCIETSPADAYWGLFWSDGTSGKWIYADLGVTSLTVPKGGWVAFVFQKDTTATRHTLPSMTPIAPGSSGGGSPGGGTTGKTAKPKAPKTTRTPAAGAAPTATASSAPSTGPTATTSTPTTPAPTTTPTTTQATTPTPSTPATEVTLAADGQQVVESDSATPVWMWAVVAVVLGGLVTGAVVVARRRGA